MSEVNNLQGRASQQCGYNISSAVSMDCWLLHEHCTRADFKYQESALGDQEILVVTFALGEAAF